MIQAVMLIALGFLIASLIGVLLAPSFWARASRLSKKRLEAALPLTLGEIEAAQDQLRATYAVRVRRLESSLARAKQKAANQLVENSRLHMQIMELKDCIADFDLKLSERRNAATVLEQTITKRFPELDREVAAVRAQLQERSYELQELTGKLARREEELAAAQEATASYQDELQRVHQALERSAADRSGRRVRRASQWNLDDYRAEYDRLNLELSKLRQQLVLFQDRDAQQVGVIKGELQSLAELIIAAAQSKSGSVEPEQLEPSLKRDARRERPAPWRNNAQLPMPLAARLKLNNAEAAAAEQMQRPAPEPGGLPQSISTGLPEAALAAPSPVQTVLAEEAVLASAQANKHGEESGRPKILQEIITAKSEPQNPEVTAKPRETEAILNAQEPKPPIRLNGDGAEEKEKSTNGADMANAPATEAAKTAETAKKTPLENQDQKRGSGSNDPKAALNLVPEKSGAGEGVRRASSQNGSSGESLLDSVSLDSLPRDAEEERIGPHLPTLLERLRSIGEDRAESEKPLRRREA